MQFQDTLGILQHHDAITGTSSTHNNEDYMKRLNETLAMINQVNFKIIQKLAASKFNLALNENDFEYDKVSEQLPDMFDHFLISKNYSEVSEFLVLCVNPSPEEERHTRIKFHVPYQDFTINILNDHSEEQINNFDELLPQLFQDDGEVGSIFFSEVYVPL